MAPRSALASTLFRFSGSLSHELKSARHDGLGQVEAGADQFLDKWSSHGNHALLSGQKRETQSTGNLYGEHIRELAGGVVVNNSARWTVCLRPLEYRRLTPAEIPTPHHWQHLRIRNCLKPRHCVEHPRRFVRVLSHLIAYGLRNKNRPSSKRKQIDPTGTSEDDERRSIDDDMISHPGAPSQDPENLF